MASGAYIINEYEILKKIFTNLSSKDLLSASQVCSEWEKTARRILTSRAAIRWHATRKPWSAKHDIPLDLKIAPKLTLYITKSPDSKKNTGKVFSYVLSKLKESYDLSQSHFLTLLGTYAINFDSEPASLLFDESSLDLLVLLPEFEGLKVSLHTVQDKHQKEAFDECRAAVWSSTCSIILSSSDAKSIHLANSLMARFSKRDRLKVIGGIAPYMYSLHGEKKACTRLGMCALTLNLPTFQCDGPKYIYTDILTNEKKMSKFFQKMADAVGPLEPGWLRLGLVVSCINRLNEHDDLEEQLFSRHLPGIPLFGFSSLGEFYYMGPTTVKRRHEQVGEEESGDLLRIKRNDFFYQESSCYVVLTFKK